MIKTSPVLVRAPGEFEFALAAALSLLAFGALAEPADQSLAGSTPPPQVAGDATLPLRKTNRLARASPPLQGRKALLAKLESIRFEQVQFENMRLGDVLLYLKEQTRKRDPAQHGVNFILNSTPPTGAGPELSDLASMPIQINPPLNNLRLVDVIDAIVRMAPVPIRCSIEEYAVVFSWRGGSEPLLHSRTFKVDPNTFQQGLEGVTESELQTAARRGSY
jgi:hypothetical protein